MFNVGSKYLEYITRIRNTIRTILGKKGINKTKAQNIKQYTIRRILH
jgi:hypothetical protein